MSEREDGQVVASLTRGLKLMDVLWEHAAEGLLPVEIAQAARESQSYVTRGMATLEASGWVERTPQTKRWRPSARMVRRLGAVKRAIDTAESRIGEYRDRCNTDL